MATNLWKKNCIRKWQIKREKNNKYIEIWIGQFWLWWLFDRPLPAKIFKLERIENDDDYLMKHFKECRMFESEYCTVRIVCAEGSNQTKYKTKNICFRNQKVDKKKSHPTNDEYRQTVEHSIRTNKNTNGIHLVF